MRLPEGIHGVIFDVDGVLLDSMGIWQDLGARYLTSIGVEPEDGLGGILFNMSLEQGAAYLKQHYHLHQSEGEIADGVTGMLEKFYAEEVRLKPAVVHLLEELRAKGMPMCIASSSPIGHITAAFARLGLLDYFQEIFTTTMLETSKHEPMIYDTAAEAMHCSREEVLVFEDALYAAKTAVQAGYHVYGVYDPSSRKDEQAMRHLCEDYLKSFDE